MKKLITLPKKYDEKLMSKIDGVILGVKDLSIGFNCYESVDTLLSSIDYYLSCNLEVFISLNKNMYNSDLDYLKSVIDIISKKKINGILYYDIGVYNLIKDLNIPLYWAQEHLTTNYMTCNFWKKRGVCGVAISSDITANEVIDIKKKTNMKIIVQVYGYIRMMASSRKLITNYLEYINHDKNFSSYEILESVSNKKYPIIEDNNSTITLSDKCINGSKYINDFNNCGIDYILFDFINIEEVGDVLDNFDKLEEKEEYFLSRKTIFKVKK